MRPTICAEVGDIITIYFKNKSEFPLSVHPHGVFYEKDWEGALFNDGTQGKVSDTMDTEVLKGHNDRGLSLMMMLQQQILKETFKKMTVFRMVKSINKFKINKIPIIDN